MSSSNECLYPFHSSAEDVGETVMGDLGIGGQFQPED